jgi:hypothetical protein
VLEAAKVPGISVQAVEALGRLKVALAGFNENAHPWDVLAKVLLDRTRIAGEIARSDTVCNRTRGIAIWQLMNFLRVQPKAQGLPIMRTMDRVRRLLLLGDDRDLRQLPTSAQSIDAVRIMTIHGSKGLEFEVVHLPGFNQGTIPRSTQRSACPPPDGLVEGGTGRAVDLLKIGHEEEQECLFFVAMSRARDQLFLYAPTKKSNGTKWGLSSYFSRLSTAISQNLIAASGELPEAPEDAKINLVVEGGLSFKGDQMRLYGKCPRRFLYTHVLEIGGRRTSTAFMLLHEAVRSVYKAVVDGAASISDDEQLNERVDASFAEQGLADHGYAKEYRAFALPMLRFFLASRDGKTAEKPTALSLVFENERIVVMPDDVLVRTDGKRIFRRVRTGHHSASHAEDLDSAALVMAAQQAFPDATIELLHLADQKSEKIDMTRKKLGGHKEDIDSFLKGIRLGQFPAKPSSRTCPGCPAFFVCGPTPPGALQKKF